MAASTVAISGIRRIRGRGTRIGRGRSGIVVGGNGVERAKKLGRVTVRQRRRGRHLYAEMLFIGISLAMLVLVV